MASRQTTATVGLAWARSICDYIDLDTPASRVKCATCAPTTTWACRSNPDVAVAAHEALRTHGYGMRSVRYICGTPDLHKTLEARLSRFLGAEDTLPHATTMAREGHARE